MKETNSSGFTKTSQNQKEIALIACTNSKTEEPALPKDLYQPSDLFSKKWSFCSREHDDQYILSAKHGLIHAEEKEIEPYDETLSGARVAKKREWAEKVWEQMKERGNLLDHTLVIHAGKAYYEELLPYLDEAGVEYRIAFQEPIAGLPEKPSAGIGTKKSHYMKANEEAENR